MSVDIRVAGADDAEVVVAMKRALLDTYIDAGMDAHPEWEPKALERARALLGRDTHRFWIASIDGRDVGSLSAALEIGLPGPTWPGVSALLSDMFVEPDVRGQGVARLLMDEALAWIRAAGARNCKLHSTPMAVGVYERLGFHVAEAKPGDERFPVMWHDFE